MSVVLFCMSLSACEGRDSTWPRRFSELGSETPTGPVAAPADAGATEATDAGETPRGVARPPTADAGAPVQAFDCSSLPVAPLAFETLPGFTSSEDFVFDERGNYVGVDEDHNLVRISRSGQKELWYPALGDTTGMAILRDGSVVYGDRGEGALKRIYPNGSLVPVLGGLLYPNGLDIGPDGYVYVAENAGGRVRRVNPDTGEFSVIAMGLTGPNGVAFSNDPRVLYIGSFEGSGVYKLELSDDPAQLARASVFARPNGSSLPEPLIACPDLVEGVECLPSGGYRVGTCQALGNVIDCLPVDPCPELADGEACDYPAGGMCEAGRCVETPTGCEGLAEGAACGDDLVGRGSCEPTFGELHCIIPNPCEGLSVGAPCEDQFSGRGVCEPNGAEPYCAPINPCDGLPLGAACQDQLFGAGRCEGTEGVYVYCSTPDACEGLREGSPCEEPLTGAGVCDISGSLLYCRARSVCDGQRQGAPCEDTVHGPGFCEPVDGSMSCLPDVCEGLRDGTPCEDPFVSVGVCQAGSCTYPSGGVDARIDGMGVDACGNVYASQFTSGVVWRISPEGEMEVAVQLQSQWIPNIKWGRDLGGFSSGVMYVADRDEGRLFGIAVGVPGATEFYATVP